MADNEKDDLKHKTWDELPASLREAMIEEAQNRLFWKQFGGKFGQLKGIASVILTLIALYVVLKDSAAQWIMNIGDKP